MNNLKPCPFCGSQAILKQTGKDTPDFPFESFWVECSMCPCQFGHWVSGYEGEIDTGLYDTKDEALTSWNKRA